MSNPAVPRELRAVLVAVTDDEVSITFDLGEPIRATLLGWFTYGIELGSETGGLARHFGVRFSPTETKAFVFDFASATQANYDGDYVTDLGSSVVVRFRDASLGVSPVRRLTGFSTIEGADILTDVPVQLLS